MRDEKEGRKKQARSNKQQAQHMYVCTEQGNIHVQLMETLEELEANSTFYCLFDNLVALVEIVCTSSRYVHILYHHVILEGE